MNGKENGVYIHTGRLLIHKKEQNFTIYNNINGPWGHYAKRNIRERQIHMVYLICAI